MLVGGELIFYVERGGKTLLSFSEDSDPAWLRRHLPLPDPYSRVCSES